MTPLERDVDVDARFLLANERTCLAWVRTALTLVAVGVGIQQFGEDLDGRWLLATALVALGGAAALAGALRYRSADRSIRQGRLPPKGSAPGAVAGSVVVLSALVLVAILADVGA